MQSFLLKWFGESKVQYVHCVFLQGPWQTQDKIIWFDVAMQETYMVHALNSL